MCIEISYRIMSGIASKNWEITSGGVIIAAKTKNVTIRWLLNSANWSVVANSSFKSNITIRGNWKLMPRAKVSRKTKW